MARRKDWFEKALDTVAGEVARGIGKRLRKAIQDPPKPQVQTAMAATPFQAAPPAPMHVQIFQGPTQVVQRGQRSEVRGQKRKRAPRARTPKPESRNSKAIDVDFEVKP